ncbi:MAG: CoA-binding protein [Limnohabitans sp.]|nr:CoA-binding protein [Limnohabitans sp.]
MISNPQNILKNSKIIAVVGISVDNTKPSFTTSQYMQSKGYTIVPVNPRYANNSEKILGQTCYATLEDIPFPVDIVNVFRPTLDVWPIAQSSVQIHAKCLWQQSGIENIQAHQFAVENNMASIMNRCIKIEHQRFYSK